MTPSSKPLAGRRICITRARQQAGSLSEALQALGAQVIAAPMIEIVPPDSYAPLDEALAYLSRYDWLVLTSANGAAAMQSRMQAQGMATRAERQKPKIIAIGPATAMTLEKHGWTVSAMPKEYVAESVVEALREDVVGKRVLLVRAKVARDVIPEELQRLGAQVDVVEAYQTVMPADASERLRAIFAAGAALPEAITFTSSSTVKHFFLLLHAAGLELPKGMVVASIGPITSQTLLGHGIEPDVEAQAHTIPGLVDAMTRFFADYKC